MIIFSHKTYLFTHKTSFLQTSYIRHGHMPYFNHKTKIFVICTKVKTHITNTWTVFKMAHQQTQPKLLTIQ